MRFVAAALAAVCTIAFGGPTSAADWQDATVAPLFHFDTTLLERPSPATVDLDASWSGTLPFTIWTPVKDLPRFHCDGAVIMGIEVQREGNAGRHQFLNLRIHVGLRKGDDRDIAMDVNFLDGERVLGSAQVKKQNLDERRVADFTVSLKIPEVDFDRFKKGEGRPILRVVLKIAEQD